MEPHNIAVIAGEGIGQAVMREGPRGVEAACTPFDRTHRGDHLAHGRRTGSTRAGIATPSPSTL